MKKTIYFTKMSGAGNDFVVIDNMDESLQVDKSKIAIALCSRYFGVGADGLLLLEPSSKADFFMRYYNADGSYGGMCGNGGRCIARYAYVNGIAGENVNFEALDYLYTAEISSTSVKLQMKNPNDFRFDLLVVT
ncbi:MAG: diaminopimelate epimerase, partial [Bacteroidota bacterium]